MKFKDSKAKKDWEKCVEVNSKDFYSKGVVDYAECWADLMEEAIATGEAEVKDIATKTSNQADKDGITGYMYNCALNILIAFWKHGEELSDWHNKKYGEEGLSS